MRKWYSLKCRGVSVSFFRLSHQRAYFSCFYRSCQNTCYITTRIGRVQNSCIIISSYEYSDFIKSFCEIIKYFSRDCKPSTKIRPRKRIRCHEIIDKLNERNILIHWLVGISDIPFIHIFYHPG